MNYLFSSIESCVRHLARTTAPYERVNECKDIIQMSFSPTFPQDAAVSLLVCTEPGICMATSQSVCFVALLAFANIRAD